LASRQKGAAELASPLPTYDLVAGLLRPSGRGRNRRRPHTYFDLLRLRFLAFRNRQRQHTVLIVGLDRFRVHGVSQREAPAECAVSAFHAQIIFFVYFLLELALTANRQDII